MKPVVVDASVAVAWYLEEAGSASARPLQGGAAPLLAPDFLLLEVANVIITQQRRRLPTPPGYPEAALAELRSGAIEWIPAGELTGNAAVLAARTLHPVYDCLYLALCRQREAVLATFDRRLATLATTLAIPLWSPEAP
jgi:predicted nucleic acid-binding protein